MHRASHGTRYRPRVLACLLWLGLACGLLDAPARAVPSFAEQTGQPCAACHVGAFGPQLKPFGREFKLYGYTSTEGKPWRPPVAMTIQTSFTHTQDAQPGGAARARPGDNHSLDA